ncbi:MAG: hypothetical protein KGM43_01125 [Planctomycetota bacterium]|nr:hypothetical protein [Planctomycetota bacterium]
MTDRRKFAIQLKRDVLRELDQYADIEIEAVSESDARAIAERMIAEDAKDIVWKDEGDVDDDPGSASVDWVEEAKN